MRPTIYIESSILSYLTARPNNDIRVMANQNYTIEWWEQRRKKFDLYISEFVVVEISQGNPDAAKRRIKSIKGIPELKVTEAVKFLAKAFIKEGPIPKNAEIDAYHIAVATVHGMEYMLTWNCTHIANAVMRPKLETVCRMHGYEPPIICTSQEHMED